MKTLSRLLMFIFTFVFFDIAIAQKGNNSSSLQKGSKDSLHIIYNARTGRLNKYPPYEINQNGYIIFEIKDINLFRYSVSVTELQGNVINSTKLSEGNTQVNIDPTIFNLGEINLKIPSQAIANKSGEKAKELSEIENTKRTKQAEIDVIEQKIQRKESQYLSTQNRLNTIDEINKEIADLNNKLVQYSKNTSTLSKSEKQSKSHLEYLKSNLEDRIQRLSQLNNIESDRSFITNYTNNERIKLETILNNLRAELEVIELDFRSKKDSDDDSNLKLVAFEIARDNYIQSLKALNRLTDVHQRLVSILYSDKSYDDILVEKGRVTLQLFGTTDQITQDHVIELSQRKLRNVEAYFQKVSKAYKEITENSEAEKVFNIISAFHSQINYSAYNTFFLQLASIYDAINETNFNLKYQTFILSDNADLINFTLIGVPHENLPGSVETKTVNFQYDVKIKGGVKIDVSTGVFWNIGLNDKNFRFESNDDVSTRVIEEANKNLYTPSFGVLFHVYKRSFRDIKFGFNIGASTNSERLNYYLGSSILFGKSQRINLNFGLAGAQVSEVSDMFDTKEILNIPIGDLPSEVPLRNPNPFRIGAFLGVSFNLSGKTNKDTLSQITRL